MGGSRPGVPDPTVVSEIRQVINLPKAWVASGEMAWVDAGGKPAGFTFRERLALPDKSQPAHLFVECYFKPSSLPGCDKLSLGLFFNHHRVFGVDEFSRGGHFNSVGAGRPYFQQRIGMPHVHTVSDDAIVGYAEPIESMSFDGYWDYFISCAGITGAPSFQLPVLQLGLLP